MKLHDSRGKLYVAHFEHDEKASGEIRGHVWRGLTRCWIHEGECVLWDQVCHKSLIAQAYTRCSTLDVFRKQDGYRLAFRRAVDVLTIEQSRAPFSGEYADLIPVSVKEQRRALWVSYRQATASRKPRRIAEPRTLKDADRILDRLGVFLLSKGDKRGWAACDAAGHVLRGQGKVVLDEGVDDFDR